MDVDPKVADCDLSNPGWVTGMPCCIFLKLWCSYGNQYAVAKGKLFLLANLLK